MTLEVIIVLVILGIVLVSSAIIVPIWDRKLSDYFLEDMVALNSKEISGEDLIKQLLASNNINNVQVRQGKKDKYLISKRTIICQRLQEKTIPAIALAARSVAMAKFGMEHAFKFGFLKFLNFIAMFCAWLFIPILLVGILAEWNILGMIMCGIASGFFLIALVGRLAYIGLEKQFLKEATILLGNGGYVDSTDETKIQNIYKHIVSERVFLFYAALVGILGFLIDVIFQLLIAQDAYKDEFSRKKYT